MRYPYRVLFNDGTEVVSEANTRDVVLWEMQWSTNHNELQREGVPLAEFAWLVHASERRQERTDLALLAWLDTVDTIEPAVADDDERNPLTDEGEGPLVPLGLTPRPGD